MVVDTVAQDARKIKSVGGTLCHLELEKDKIKIGKKYQLNLKSGQKFGRIGIDKNEESGVLTVSMCMTRETGSSKEVLEISSVTEAGSKGKVSYRSATLFDATVKGKLDFSSKDSNATGSDQFS
jgi:hypothetical protein